MASSMIILLTPSRDRGSHNCHHIPEGPGILVPSLLGNRHRTDACRNRQPIESVANHTVLQHAQRIAVIKHKAEGVRPFRNCGAIPWYESSVFINGCTGSCRRISLQYAAVSGKNDFTEFIDVSGTGFCFQNSASHKVNRKMIVFRKTIYVYIFNTYQCKRKKVFVKFNRAPLLFGFRFV